MRTSLFDALKLSFSEECLVVCRSSTWEELRRLIPRFRKVPPARFVCTHNVITNMSKKPRESAIRYRLYHECGTVMACGDSGFSISTTMPFCIYTTAVTC